MGFRCKRWIKDPIEMSGGDSTSPVSSTVILTLARSSRRGMRLSGDSTRAVT